MAKRSLDLTDYPSNSAASKREAGKPGAKAKPKTVAKGRARKQSLARKIGKSIIEDSVSTARERAISDIVVPGFKALIFDTFTEILNIALFGESGAGYKPRGGGAPKKDHVSYREYYNRKDRGRHVETSPISFEPDDIIVDSRAEARAVFEEIDHIIDRYGQATVADFYDIVGVTSQWTDCRYGWTSISQAGIRPVRDGFMLIMPRTQVLED